MKTRPDAERFAKYQSVVNVLQSKDPFCKPEIYEALEDAAVMEGLAKLRNLPFLKELAYEKFTQKN
jgi:hypothetical protein